MRLATRKIVALITLQALLAEIVLPAGQLFALTSGPSQPEFSKFEPVTTTNMVDPLTGQFTYNLPLINIPGPSGSGYSLSLSYHSGASPEEEASWVGYGWTLNPGSISRMKRGFPDDYNGETVRYWNKAPANWTVTAGYKENVEAFSFQPLEASGSLRYNNYRGFGYVGGISADVMGLATLSATASNEGWAFTNDIQPAALLGKLGMMMRSPNDPGYLASVFHGTYFGTIGSYLNYSVSNETRPTNFAPYDGVSAKVSLEGLTPPGPLPIGPNGKIFGSFTTQSPVNNGLRLMKAFGYMYSANAGANDMMDYYVEKETPYSRKDRFLSTPFANADLYTVSGQGIGGGFRLYNKKPGQFHPNHVESSTAIVNFEFQGHLGPTNFGAGAGFGVGAHTLSVGAWNSGDNAYKFAGDADGDEPYFFRMNNDLGGDVGFADNDDAVAATVSNAGSGLIPNYQPSVNSADVKPMNGGKRSGRSTYIGYSTNKEILHSPALGNGLFPNLQAHHAQQVAASSYNEYPDAVAEFGLTRGDGAKYTYGLPVFSRKEKNLEYGLDGLNVSQIKDRNLVYAHATPNYAATVVGEERDGAYASSYLLTEITTSDYVDRSMDGATSDDFGGYTRFDYVRTAGEGVDYSKFNVDPTSIPPSNSSTPRRFNRGITDPTKWAKSGEVDENTWYKWRVPYNGLQYQMNSLSDEKDDMGSMAMGEREVYYLGTVETKTHVAVFVTNGGIYTHGKWFPGSGEQRKDGYEAVHDEYSITNDPDATRAQGVGGPAYNHLRKLERVELWSKGEDGSLKELLQTVHFEYDYSLCPGAPNAYKEPGQSTTVGKLTLKRVYTEYNGVISARISPYVFGYEYRKGTDYNGLATEDRTKYQSIIDYANNYSSGEQNPSYNHYLLDRWGYYQLNGQQRHQRMNPYEDQNADPAQFDPAAWQLKWIRLPSGGEIHVQYEQNDYSYVQDQVATVMAPLSGGVLISGKCNKYYLDLAGGFGIASNSVAMKNLVEAIRAQYVDGDERMFFKVLHSLDGNPADIANVDGRRLDYMKGYVKLTDVGIETAGPHAGEVYISMADGDESTPTDLAHLYARTIRPGIVGTPGMRDEGDPKSRVSSLTSRIGENFAPSLVANTNLIDWDDSYVRIPIGRPDRIVLPKRGGGLRVHHLLMYDQGLEASGGHLFGTEYIYKTVSGASSGVASNEPAEGREENALVKPLDRRRDQSWLERIIAGRDIDQFEGPIGESLLPNPTVMYSRVVERSIHSGRTNSGFTIHEFYTSRDYPSQCIYGPQQGEGVNTTKMNRVSDFLVIPALYFNYNKANIFAAQGYRFVLNDMAGRVRKVSTYGGSYFDPASKWVPSSSQEYVYFQPGEKVPMLHEYSTQPTYTMEDPGKEMEITLEGRAVDDITVDASGHADASIGIYPGGPPPLFITIVPMTSVAGDVSYAESRLKTHVTCKVVRYPSLVKQVISRQDGIESIVENVGFNPLTGEAVASRTTDGYSGLVLQQTSGGGSATVPHNRSYKTFSYPAAQQYLEMGQKAQNERATILNDPANLVIDKRFEGGRHYLTFKYVGTSRICSASDLLAAGDMIDLFTTTDGTYDPQKSLGVFHIDKVSGNRVMLLPHSGSIPTLLMSGVSIRVMRSGRTNQLSVPRAGITVYTAD